MQTVNSADGTPIAYEQHGDGPSIVLVHGGSVTQRAWAPLLPHLDDTYTLIVPDRRGRGASGDADSYTLAREVADVQALVATVDTPVTLFGHSYGGLIALAAAQDLTVDRLILYEPSILVDEYHRELATRMQTQLAAGDRETAMKLFYQDGVGLADPETLPFWPDAIQFELAETVLREAAVVEQYTLPEQLAITAPTLLITGDQTAAHLRAAVTTLHERLPQAQLVVLEDAGHMAITAATAQVADAVRSFVPSSGP